MPLKKLSTGSIFPDIDAIWSPRLMLSERPAVLLSVLEPCTFKRTLLVINHRNIPMHLSIHVPLKKLNTRSIFHDIDAIWLPRLILCDRLSVLLLFR